MSPLRQATEVLRKDHARIRRILDVLEHLLRKGEEVPHAALALLLNHLEQELEGHLRREEEILLPFLVSVTGGLRGYHFDRDHGDIHTSIQFMALILGQKEMASVSSLVACGDHLVEILREHMDDEEATIFPLAEQALGEEFLENPTGQAG